MTRISTACSWVNIGCLCKAAILAQVGHFYSGGVGQYYSGANMHVARDGKPSRIAWFKDPDGNLHNLNNGSSAPTA
jgi:hypothetical protein